VTGTTPGARGGDDIGYAEALAELEGILDELDGDEVDVDVLGARVRRASELLRLCRERIAGARFEVEQVVAELEAEADAATAASPGPGAGDDEGDDEGDGDEGDEDEDEGYRGEGG
jgi:exodeoxyribonuclease VII small subunit